MENNVASIHYPLKIIYFRFLDFCDNTKIDDLTLFKQLPVSDMIPVIHR